jgi:hypothetical protein
MDCRKANSESDTGVGHHDGLLEADVEKRPKGEDGSSPTNRETHNGQEAVVQQGIDSTGTFSVYWRAAIIQHKSEQQSQTSKQRY